MPLQRALVSPLSASRPEFSCPPLVRGHERRGENSPANSGGDLPVVSTAVHDFHWPCVRRRGVAVRRRLILSDSRPPWFPQTWGAGGLSNGALGLASELTYPNEPGLGAG